MIPVDKVLKSNTDGGKAWLEKYLHPPSAKRSSYAGYPDMNGINAVHMEHRLVDEVAIPVDPTNANTLGAVYLYTPGLLYPCFRFPWAADDAVKPNFYQNVVLKNNQWTQQTVLQNFAKVRTAYSSITCELDATNFNNTGTIYGAQQNFSVSLSSMPYTLLKYAKTSPEIIPMLEKEFNLVEGTLKSFVTAFELQHFTLTESSGLMIPRELLIRDIQLPEDKLNKDSNVRFFNESVIDLVSLGKHIKSPSDITMASISFYQSALLEGTYSPLRINQPINSWRNIQSGDLAESGVFTSKLCYKGFTNLVIVNGVTTEILYLPTDGVGGSLITDIPYGDFSFYLFGIKNGTSTVSLLPANLRLKAILGFEFAAMPGSAFNSFLTAPPIFDREALDQGALITNERKDAYPASFNAKSKIALGNDEGVKEAVNQTEKHEKKNLSSLIGRPIRTAENIAKEAAKLAKLVTSSAKPKPNESTPNRPRMAVKPKPKQVKQQAKPKVKHPMPTKEQIKAFKKKPTMTRPEMKKYVGKQAKKASKHQHKNDKDFAETLFE
jgi:hypothetical protein